MSINLLPNIESMLSQAAANRGVTPEELANELLQTQLGRRQYRHPPRDEWERQLQSLGQDCGVVLPDSAWSSDGLYE